MMYSILKKLFLIIFICYVRIYSAPGLIKLNIVLPLTFLACIHFICTDQKIILVR